MVHDVMQLPPGSTVVHGGARGVDSAAGQSARELGLVEEVHPVEPERYGGNFARAALARNAYVETVGADGEARVWIAPWSRGSWDAARKAERAGVPRVLREYLRDGGVRVTRWPPPASPPRPRVRYASLRGYAGPGRLDISHGSGHGEGRVFAPTPQILEPAIAERHRANELLRRADKLATTVRPALFSADAAAERQALVDEAAAIELAAWGTYLPAFLGEQRVSAGLSPRSPRWGEHEEAAARRGVTAHPETWRRAVAGELGSYDDDGSGARLTVVQCHCAEHWQRMGHCHAVVVAGLWARMGAQLDGPAKGWPWPAIVCVRGAHGR